MFEGDVLWNASLMILCYVYILLVILVSGKMEKLFHASAKVSRKFLHAMIGNLPFVIPFFTSSVYPVLVAAPFVLVTFCASPYSPFPNIRRRLTGLASITEEGHRLGLVFYSISYTILAWFFASRPYVIAAGILPMAYGDATASIVGERYGRRRYRLLANKSLEGSAAMFVVSLFSLLVGSVFFSLLYSFSALGIVFPVLFTATVATLAEGFSPLDFDNLLVPASSVLAFLASGGGL